MLRSFIFGRAETSCINCGYHDYGNGFKPLSYAEEWEKLTPIDKELNYDTLPTLALPKDLQRLRY